MKTPVPVQADSAARRRPPTRRLWRIVFRRARVYLPIIVALLLAMIVWLPLSPPWMARRIESELSKRTGLPITIDSARLRLASGEVILRGIAVPARDAGEQPFAIREIKMTGPLSELLAGDGGWPSNVEIVSLPLLEFDARNGQLQELGALRTLRRALSERPRAAAASRTAGAASRDDDATTSSTLFDGLLVRTPRVLVRNVVVGVKTPRAVAGDEVSIVLRSLEIPARPDPADAVTLNVQGTAFAGLAEAFSGIVVVDPIDHHLDASLEVGGIKRDFTVQGFGEVHAGLRGIHIEARAQRDADGNWPIDIESSAAEFELSESRVGGETWVEKDLSFAAIATLGARGTWAHDVRMGVTASQLDVRLSGDVEIDDGRLPGHAFLDIRQIPAPMLALAQRAARSNGVDVVANSGATLRMDLRAGGDFAQIESIDPVGSLEMTGWQVVGPRMPYPVTIDTMRATITPQALAIQRLDVAMQGLRGGGSAFVPLLTDDDAPATATIALEVRGPASAMGEVARSLEVMPREIESIDAPITVAVAGSALMEPWPGVAFLPRMGAAPPVVTARVGWGEGSAALRDVAGVITFAPGAFDYAGGVATLSHLNARLGELQLNADATLSGIDPAAESILGGAMLDGTLIAQGPVQQALALVAGRVTLPIARDDVSGNVRVQVSTQTPLKAMATSSYQARVSLDDGRLVVRLPENSFLVDELSLDLALDNDLVTINRLNARVAEQAQLRASGEVTRERIAIDFDVAGSIAVAAAVSPRDVSEMVLDGQAHGKGWARVLVKKPLPTTGHVVGDWARAFAQPDVYRVSALDDADLRVDLDAQLYPGENVTVFHRDLPWPITNIRGDVRADETGFQIHDVRASLGNAHDVHITNGRVKLGHMGLPIELEFAADVPDIDTNEWFEGWGQRPWAERPFVTTRPSRWKLPDGGLMMTTIRADLNLASTKFLSVRGTDAKVHFEYDVWRGRHNDLRVQVPRAGVYGGRVHDLNAALTFPKDHGAPTIDAIGYGDGIQMRDFLTDLRQRPDPFVGLFTGHATLKGILTDKSTWTGEGVYTVKDSHFLGEQALVALSTAMSLGRDASSSPTRWDGTASWRDRRVYFPDMTIENSRIRLRAKGDIDFAGALDFIVTVQLLSNRLEGIWLLGQMAPIIDGITDFLVTMRLRGTIQQPEVMTMPLNLDQAIFFRRDPPGASTGPVK